MSVSDPGPLASPNRPRKAPSRAVVRDGNWGQAVQGEARTNPPKERIEPMSVVDRPGTRRARFRKWFAKPSVQFVARTIYYMGILAGLVALYGRGDFSTPPFIYQNF